MEETLFCFTEKFSSAEKLDLLQKIIASAEAAKTKLDKYFGVERGWHPSKQFVSDIRFFDPKQSLLFRTKNHH